MRRHGLSPEAQPRDQGLVAIEIIILNVSKESSSLTDQFEKAASRVMILFVRLEMLCQIFNSRSKQGHLNLGRSSVSLMRCVFCNYLSLLCCCNRHFSLLLYRILQQNAHGVSAFAAMIGLGGIKYRLNEGMSRQERY